MQWWSLCRCGVWRCRPGPPPFPATAPPAAQSPLSEPRPRPAVDPSGQDYGRRLALALAFLSMKNTLFLSRLLPDPVGSAAPRQSIAG